MLVGALSAPTSVNCPVLCVLYCGATATTARCHSEPQRGISPGWIQSNAGRSFGCAGAIVQGAPGQRMTRDREAANLTHHASRSTQHDRGQGRTADPATCRWACVRTEGLVAVRRDRPGPVRAPQSATPCRLPATSIAQPSGGRACQGNRSSQAAAARNTVASSCQRPTNCSATGNPSRANPQGIVAAGWPVTLNG